MDSIHPLRAFREKQHPPLTQEQLAGLLGCSRVAVTRWESGRRKPDIDDVAAISAKTGIPAAELRPDIAEIFVSTLRRRGPARPRGAARSKSAA